MNQCHSRCCVSWRPLAKRITLLLTQALRIRWKDKCSRVGDERALVFSKTSQTLTTFVAPPCSEAAQTKIRSAIHRDASSSDAAYTVSP
ncbi:hypothetical protein BH11PLA2_BH11PLA2_45260 [soil metagenome]